MKVKNYLLSISFAVFIWIGLNPQSATAQGVSVNFQVFYDELSPYGTWVNNDDYGYVWVPDVAPGFTPYGTNGYWVFTDEGWTWVSDYPWGWAPFHYGRWFYDASYGPMWVPDNQWGPGWVTWRRSSGYYGWAPIGPGISISIAYGNGYNPPHDQWRFVREHDFGRTNINNYYVNTTNNVTIINNSTVINNMHENKTRNVSYNAGPDRVEVEKHIGRAIVPVAIKENNKPGQQMSKGELEIYRPRVENNNPGTAKPAPVKVSSLKDVKPASQRNVEAQPQKENKPAVKQQIQPQRDVKPTLQTQPKQEARPVEQKQPSREGQPLNHQQQQVAPVKRDQQQQPQQQHPQQPQQQPQPRSKEQSQPSMESQPATPEQPKPQHESPQKQEQPKREVHPLNHQPSQPKPNVHPARQQPNNNKPQQPKQENPEPGKK